MTPDKPWHLEECNARKKMTPENCETFPEDSDVIKHKCDPQKIELVHMADKNLTFFFLEVSHVTPGRDAQRISTGARKKN